ncbi:ABC transporter ATP-binding protein [Rhizobium sp. AG207R]|uniref:ABC transporter ATP-binding protein n=1 Tax=Rhizobium sp. AG207R TaxID=2802287 RepID=UPI0022ABE5C7|nr:ABC transporter ATP-binding protein [Rhizobium sp. AG207R]MCZ3374336.1 ABC transporter ATP-binding protein [Rhizobium sp. AG207R]
MGVVKANNVSVAFGAVKVIENLNLDIKEGEFVVLLGSSGCGKSTLLNCIAGLQEIADGEIWIGDDNVTWAEPKDRGVGMVFQSYALYPRMTVHENLSFGLRMAKMPKAEIEKRVARAVSILQIEKLLDRRPAELSGGQRQRVAIGRALVRDVDVFLFDEPLSNLDAKLRTELRVEIKKLHQQLGSTMIYVTHDQIEAMTLADRIAVMNKGIIQQFAPPKQVYTRPANRFVAGFVGSPSMNFIKATVTDAAGQDAKTFDGRSISLRGYDGGDRLASGKQIEIGVRPEQWIVADPTVNDKALEARVTVVENTGAESLIWAKIGDETVSVKVADDTGYFEGQTLQLSFNPAFVSVFDTSSGERI